MPTGSTALPVSGSQAPDLLNRDVRCIVHVPVPCPTHASIYACNSPSIHHLPPKLPDACAAPPIVDMRSPTTLLTSKNLAEHRSMQTASPLSRSPSAYRCDVGLGWMHLVWHELTRRLLVISSSCLRVLIERKRRSGAGGAWNVKSGRSDLQDVSDHVELGHCHLDLGRVDRAGVLV
jgi:hypothetical protein